MKVILLMMMLFLLGSRSENLFGRSNSLCDALIMNLSLSTAGRTKQFGLGFDNDLDRLFIHLWNGLFLNGLVGLAIDFKRWSFFVCILRYKLG